MSLSGHRRGRVWWGLGIDQGRFPHQCRWLPRHMDHCLHRAPHWLRPHNRDLVVVSSCIWIQDTCNLCDPPADWGMWWHSSWSGHLLKKGHTSAKNVVRSRFNLSQILQIKAKTTNTICRKLLAISSQSKMRGLGKTSPAGWAKYTFPAGLNFTTIPTTGERCVCCARKWSCQMYKCRDEKWKRREAWFWEAADGEEWGCEGGEEGEGGF